MFGITTRKSESMNNTIINSKNYRLNKEDDKFTFSPSKYSANIGKYSTSNNNLTQKISNTKNELLNLRREEEFSSDFESKRLINKNNLPFFLPRKNDDSKSFINNTLGIFRTQTEKKTKETDSLANRIFNRNKSPLKSENNDKLTLTNTFRKQNKMDLFNERNSIIANPSRHAFTEKRNELINMMKAKPGSPEVSNFGSVSNRGAFSKSKDKRSLGMESKLDCFIEKKPALSLKQMDTNLKYSKIDFCTYYSSQPKIKKASNLNDFNFSRSQNKIAKLMNIFN